METITHIFLGLGLAADAFAVSLSSGITIKYMKINKALKIALFFGGFQALMPVMGWLVGLSFRDVISAIDHWLAFGLLALLGAKMIYESLQEEAGKTRFNPLDPWTLLSLSIATSLDAFAVGIGFSILKASIVTAVTVIGLITFFLSFIGTFIGHWFGDFFQDKVEMVGGCILILIGLKILIEHLSGMG